MKQSALVVLFVLIACTARAADVDFARDVRPILAQNCYACHGPDAEHREADLRLDTETSARADRDGSRAVVPGDLEHSALVKRITSTSAKKHMPPADSGKKLTAEQIEILRSWVKDGAKWSRHWAFVPPVKAPLPEVRDTAWAAQPIDRFVLAKLEQEGLHPSPAADRRTLIRRVSLDLTGLPPTPAEVDAFAHDSSPDTYEQLVDRLLASPAYGEKWARVWLDLARYADTKGYEKDRRREMWPYRDWLITSLNADMPFDEFTVEQLAGDLLPKPAESQLVATAFNRQTMTNEEGGVDPEEFRTIAVKDRVDTTVQVWMGLTMGCAKCHSHKYDPIAQKEYYQFLALFNQSEDANRGDEFPTIPFLGGTQRAHNDAIHAKMAALQRQLDEPSPALDAAMAKWEQSLPKRAAWATVEVQSAMSAGGAALKALEDGSVLASGKKPTRDTYTVVATTPLQDITAVRLEALTDRSLGDRGGPGRNASDPNFVINTFRATAAPLDTSSPEGTPVAFAGAEADFSQPNWPVAGAIDEKPETGWAISPQQGKPHIAVFRTKDKVGYPGGTRLTFVLDQQYGESLTLGRFRLSVTSDENTALNPLPANVEAVVATPATTRTDVQRTALAAYYRSIAPELAPLRSQMEQLRTQLIAPTPLPVMRDLPKEKQRVTHVHNRGSFLDPGEVVEPAVLSAFNPMPANAPRNRLGMARWIVDRQNPLTARVLVNRYWAQFFGTGIVESEEDFGSQGTPPTHPQLLDWLAVDFMDSGGSMKKLCRTIVLSNTYRQDSRATPELIEKDRFNRLLARGPRVRLDAETLRDATLAECGLLSHKIGGPSVMPIQPPGIWASVYSADKWVTSPGEDAHRRGIYTFIKRTSPYPSMETFDGTSRETCTIRRIRTNTPLQALTTLNDPVYVEAAQALARNAIGSEKDVEKRIAFAINQVLDRPATPKEIAALRGLHDRRLAWFTTHPADAAKFASDPVGPLPNGVAAPEAAAATAVCNVILNLDEAITKQ